MRQAWTAVCGVVTLLVTSGCQDADTEERPDEESVVVSAAGGGVPATSVVYTPTRYPGSPTILSTNAQTAFDELFLAVRFDLRQTIIQMNTRLATLATDHATTRTRVDNVTAAHLTTRANLDILTGKHLATEADLTGKHLATNARIDSLTAEHQVTTASVRRFRAVRRRYPPSWRSVRRPLYVGHELNRRHCFEALSRRRGPT